MHQKECLGYCGIRDGIWKVLRHTWWDLVRDPVDTVGVYREPRHHSLGSTEVYVYAADYWYLHGLTKTFWATGLICLKLLHFPLPNHELSGAKSELPGATVGVCSFHRRCGQLPYNLPITHLRFTPQSLQVCLLAHFNK